MTTMTELTAKREQFTKAAAQDDALHTRLFESTFAVILPELIQIVNPEGLNTQFDLFASFDAGADAHQYDADTAERLRDFIAIINAGYVRTYDLHMAAKKAWAKAALETHRVSTSSKSNAAQVAAAQAVEDDLHATMRATLDTFMDYRRIEEAFRHAPAAYKEQTLDAIFWLIHNIVRVCQYTPGTDSLVQRILNTLR